MDADRTASQMRSHSAGRQHLHVAGETTGICFGDDFGTWLPAGLARRHRADGRTERCNSPRAGSSPCDADDCRNVGLATVRLVTEQQIVQAVPLLRHHDQRTNTRRSRRIKIRSVLCKPLCGCGKALVQRGGVVAASPSSNCNSRMKKTVGADVIELSRFENVGALLHQKAGDTMHDAGTIGADRASAMNCGLLVAKRQQCRAGAAVASGRRR